MTDQHPTDVMLAELNAMRDEVASLARAEPDKTSYRAYLLQARNLRLILSQSAGIRADADARAVRACVTDDAAIEQDYLDMLSKWLVEHEASVSETREGGAVDKANVTSMSTAELTATRLYAERYHAMIAGFCQRHAAALRERAEELEAELGAPAFR